MVELKVIPIVPTIILTTEIQETRSSPPHALLMEKEK